MTYPKELNKDEIEESAIIAAFAQLMNQKFKSTDAYNWWKNFVYPTVKEYSINVLHIEENAALHNIKLVEERRNREIKNAMSMKYRFNSLSDVVKFLQERGINVENPKR